MRVAALRVIDEMIGCNALDNSQFVYGLSSRVGLQFAGEPPLRGNNSGEVLDKVVKAQRWMWPNPSGHSVGDVIVTAAK